MSAYYDFKDNFDKKEFIIKLKQHLTQSSRIPEYDYASIASLLKKKQITDAFIIETIRGIIYSFGDNFDVDDSSKYFWDSVIDKIGDVNEPNDREAIEAVTGWASEDGKVVFESILAVFGFTNMEYKHLVQNSPAEIEIGGQCFKYTMTRWNLRACVYLDSYGVTSGLVALVFKDYMNANPNTIHNRIINFINSRLPKAQADAIIRQIDVDCACFIENRELMELTPGEKELIDCGIRNLTKLSNIIEDLI